MGKCTPVWAQLHPPPSDPRFFFSHLHRTKFSTEKLRLISQEFPTIASLCATLTLRGKVFRDITRPSHLLDLNNPEHIFLNQIRVNLCKQAPHLAKIKILRVRSPKASWTDRALKINKNALKNGIKRACNHSEPGYVPPSYNSRLRDRAPIVQDPALFCNSYSWTTKSYIPSLFRSFHLDFLNRTLLSPNKLTKMKIPNPPPHICPHTNTLAHSEHCLMYCIFPEIVTRVLNDFLIHMNLPKVTTEWIAFQWPIKDFNFDILKQLFLLTAAFKMCALSIHTAENFHRFHGDMFHAKFISCVEKALDAARVAKLPSRLISNLSNWLPDNFLNIRYTISETIRDVAVLRLNNPI